jgi:hypothetical protein
VVELKMDKLVNSAVYIYIYIYILSKVRETFLKVREIFPSTLSSGSSLVC